MDWTEDANCKNEDPELFHPVSIRSRKSKKAIREALTICEECSVRKECLEFAEKHGEEWGVWGGINFLERNNLFSRHLT